MTGALNEKFCDLTMDEMMQIDGGGFWGKVAGAGGIAVGSGLLVNGVKGCVAAGAVTSGPVGAIAGGVVGIVGGIVYIAIS